MIANPPEREQIRLENKSAETKKPEGITLRLFYRIA